MRLGTSTCWACVMATFGPVAAHAGAWNQAAGEGQAIVTTGWFHASDIFQDDIVEVDFLGYTKVETRLWLESGLTSDLTLVVNGALQTIDYRDSLNDITFQGFDDIEIGVQWELKRSENLVASLRASYVIDSQIDNRFPDIQSNGDTVELRALLGQSRETIIGDVFHDTQLAVRVDGDGVFDSVHGTFTLGYKPTNRLMFMLQGFADHTENISSFGDRPLIRSQTSGQFSVVRQFRPGRYIQIGGRMAVDGRSAVKDRALIIGAWTEY